ncbi:hypothetical protein BJ322DRAFT_574040 [Thelephora terrestris]|uniref:Uncharacterized protein n=1 Tax=Thelephora terrestris TaxID=56493 RepID=A0A9P6L132_9AGAM|nr:hypothetical protein BJ322DRAFT_574040 [Thelephora terrestris]
MASQWGSARRRLEGMHKDIISDGSHQSPRGVELGPYTLQVRGDKICKLNRRDPSATRLNNLRAPSPLRKTLRNLRNAVNSRTVLPSLTLGQTITFVTTVRPSGGLFGPWPKTPSFSRRGWLWIILRILDLVTTSFLTSPPTTTSSVTFSSLLDLLRSGVFCQGFMMASLSINLPSVVDFRSGEEAFGAFLALQGRRIQGESPLEARVLRSGR